MAGPLTPSEYATQCLETVQGYTTPCRKQALDEATAACAGSTGNGRNQCMTVNFAALIFKYCKSQVQDCARDRAKSICDYRGYSGCSDATYSEIMSFMPGKPNFGKTSAQMAAESVSVKATTPIVQPTVDVNTVLTAESNLNLPTDVLVSSGGGNVTSQPSSDSLQTTASSSSGPLGVSWLWWGLGAAGVGFLLMNKK